MAIFLIAGYAVAQTSMRYKIPFLMIIACTVSAHLLSLSKGGWCALFIGFIFFSILSVRQYKIDKKKLILVSLIGFTFIGIVVLSNTKAVLRIHDSIDKNIICKKN